MTLATALALAGRRDFALGGTVIVAVIVVRMMKMSGHDVVGVVAVSDWFVTTARAMGVVGLVVVAIVAGGTHNRILFAHCDRSRHLGPSQVDGGQGKAYPVHGAKVIRFG